MEAFEQFVAVALEAEGYVVSSAIKFPVKRQTQKKTKEEQTHGYEVDLVGARKDQLVLATVKSFLGSRGVVADEVTGATPSKRYLLINDLQIRKGVLRQASIRYGYPQKEIQFRFYVGRFAAPARGTHEEAVRTWCGKQRVGRGAIKVISLSDVVNDVRRVAASKTYRDNPVLVTMKVLEAAGLLTPGVDTRGVAADEAAPT
jgi:hypothetical protein